MGRDGRGKFTRTLDAAQRDGEACRLRSLGSTYETIAGQLGFSDRSLARRAVERALHATVAEPAAHLRALELIRLDAALVEAFRVMHADHVVTSGGSIVVDPETGKPLRDSGPVLAAIDRIVRIGERRSKLMGLDAPTKIEGVSVDQIDSEIARLVAELGIESEPGR